MKFGEEYNTKILAFPKYVQSNVFQYSKLIQEIQQHNWKSKLRDELSKCQQVIFPLFDFSCFRHLTNAEKLELCELCSTAFYKACKKIQKNLQVPAMEFYSYTLSSHEYTFLGGSQRTALKKESVIDCPVCLDTCKEYCILRCGHSLCIDCTQKMWGHLSNSEKLMYVSFITNKTCPVCRAVMACHPSYIIIVR